jgi:hypothetical protein
MIRTKIDPRFEIGIWMRRASGWDINPGNYAFVCPHAEVLNPSPPTDAMAAQESADRNLGGSRLSVQPRHPRRR